MVKIGAKYNNIVLECRVDMMAYEMYVPYIDRLVLNEVEAREFLNRLGELYLCIYYLKCIEDKRYRKKVCDECIREGAGETIVNIHKWLAGERRLAEK